MFSAEGAVGGGGRGGEGDPQRARKNGLWVGSRDRRFARPQLRNLTRRDVTRSEQRVCEQN